MNQIQLHKIDLNLLATFEALMEEGSIAAAADRLALTPSAVSHALGRLRTQFGDPLLVRVGGRMQPTPQALALTDELAPVLRGLRRALEPPRPFDPGTSDRVFRVAFHTAPAFMTEIAASVAVIAPNVMIEWVRIGAGVYNDLADGLIDLAHVGGDTYLPDGISAVEMTPLSFFTFARKDHPAARDWSVEAARRYRYLQVAVEDTGGSPIEQQHRLLKRPRELGAKASDFASVPALLAGTDLLATMPDFVMFGAVETYGLTVLEPVAAPPGFRARLAWSNRNAADPGNQWLRDLIRDRYEAYSASGVAGFRAAAIPLTDA